MSEHLGLLEDADHKMCDRPDCWCNALAARPQEPTASQHRITDMGVGVQHRYWRSR